MNTTTVMKKFLPSIIFCSYFVFMCYIYWKTSTTSSPAFDPELLGERPFLIDTSGYRLPDYDPYDKSVISFLEPTPTNFDCSEGKRPLTTGLSNYTSGSDTEMKSVVLYHRERLSDYGVSSVSCCYRSVTRDDSNPEFPDTVFRFDAECQLITEDVTYISSRALIVSCTSESIVIYRNFHFFVQYEDVERRFYESSQNLRRTSDVPLSVMLVGIDSISRLNMQRYMPKTLQILQEYGAIDLRGFNKIAENTYPNMIPLLTGEFHSYWKEGNISPFFDNLPILWKNFSNAGYVTVFGEDCTSLGLFHYENAKKGFRKQPTDYYFHPFLQAAEDTLGWKGNLVWIAGCKACIGLYSSINVMLKYAADVSQVLRNVPYFSYLWSSAITHDRIHFAGLTDEPSATLLAEMIQGGYWNNTIVLFMADHGIRFGNIRKTFLGRVEENLPFGYIILPKWFNTAYPAAYNSLVHNQYRLVTHFDLRQTLLDVARGRYADELYSSSAYDPTNLPSMLSLFRKIPETRTCLDARIPVHYCSGIYASDALSDPRVEPSAHYLFSTLNAYLREFPQCYQLKNYTVNRAYLIKSFEKTELTSQEPSYYEIQWTTYPGNAVLEAVVEVRPKSNRVGDNNIYTIQGSISRLNPYEGQSDCIRYSGSDCIKYCLCKSMENNGL